MDCSDVRRQVLEGREKRRAVRLHLRYCRECADFQQRLQETEVLLQSALPFTAPEALSQGLYAMVPRAARELQARAANQPRPLSVGARRYRQVLQGLLILSIPLALFLGVGFWQQGLALIRPWTGQIRPLLPLIPDAVAYWGGRLAQVLAPVREAFLFIVSFLLAGLTLEQLVRSRRQTVHVTQ